MFPYDPSPTFDYNDMNPVDAPTVCPQVKYYTDPITGQKAKFIWRCNNKHTCPNCQKLEAEKYQARIWRAWQTARENGDQLVVAYVATESDLSDEIRKKVGKEGRWSIPMSTGQTCHVMRLSTAQKLESLAECQPLQAENIPQMDFTALVQSPAREKRGTGGKQMSGSLGKAQPVAVNPNLEPVTVLAFTSTAPEGALMDKLDQEVLDETADYNPKTVTEALELSDARTVLRAQKYEKAGFKTSITSHGLSVDKNVSINWGLHRNVLKRNYARYVPK